MRLLKTGPPPIGETVLEFKNFYSEHVPPYAILSHTWAQNPEEEVLFADVLNKSGNQKPGFLKVVAACRQAREDGYGYCWVDTCCIDKSSSAELSEAINSMFRWYREAAICYAYLADVPDGYSIPYSTDDYKDSVMGRSRWFTRGWTLQELLAPQEVVFFSEGWTRSEQSDHGSFFLGSKDSLSSVLSTITSIDDEILQGVKRITDASLAQRMSWAAYRTTTRVEDIAYCLLGIFDVNMPMLYGEGRKAFLRLQEEILKQSDDSSIFAWCLPESDSIDLDTSHGLLADSPKYFQGSGDIVPYNVAGQPSWSITNKGLHLQLVLLDIPDQKSDSLKWAALNCGRLGRLTHSLAIYLLLTGSAGDEFMRVNLSSLSQTATPGKGSTIFVRQTPPSPRVELVSRYDFRLVPREPRSKGSSRQLFRTHALGYGDTSYEPFEDMIAPSPDFNYDTVAKFPVKYRPRKVSVVLIYRGLTKDVASAPDTPTSRLIISLGMDSEMRPSFDAILDEIVAEDFDGPRRSTRPTYYDHLFRPSPSGSWCSAGIVRVSVSFEEIPYLPGQHVYLTDITIDHPSDAKWEERHAEMKEIFLAEDAAKKAEREERLKGRPKWYLLWRPGSGPP